MTTTFLARKNSFAKALKKVKNGGTMRLANSSECCEGKIHAMQRREVSLFNKRQIRYRNAYQVLAKLSVGPIPLLSRTWPSFRFKVWLVRRVRSLVPFQHPCPFAFILSLLISTCCLPDPPSTPATAALNNAKSRWWHTWQRSPLCLSLSGHFCRPREQPSLPQRK